MKITLKDYLAAKQLDRKLKKKINSSSFSRTIDSSKEDVSRLIDIKAKLHTYVSF